jgi:hypothetical protein
MFRSADSSSKTWLGVAFVASAAWWCPHAAAATHQVISCDDDGGSGGLRAVIAGASSGDTIDLRALFCTIELTGPITIPQDYLTLVGFDRFKLTIDGNRAGRVFDHTGAGTLQLQRMSVTGGYQAGASAAGGCIHSLGSVRLTGVRVHRCVADATGVSDFGNGGGIRAAGSVYLDHSSVFFNSARRGGGGGIAANYGLWAYHSQIYGNTAARGGGVFALGEQRFTYSLVHGNTAELAGGGIISPSDLVLNKSTVSNNRVTRGQGGGIWLWNAPHATIVDSTISGNVATRYSAGWVAYSTDLYNSTVAFNRETGPSTEPCDGAFAPGDLSSQSSIIAGNTCDTGPAPDLGGWSGSVTGARNIIGSSAWQVPPDTLSVDPRLEPLGDYGGPVRTHRPMADSPAIDHGANPFNRLYDQRGPGFPRVKGAAADVGAVER